jgi:hypothetical protein
MKRIGKILATGLVLLAGYAGETHAADDSKDAKVRLTRGAESTFVLSYLKGGKNRVRVEILDERGKTVFWNHVSNNKGFKQPFNFKGMDEGRYIFKIEDKDGVVTESVVHDSTVGLPTAKITKLDEERYELSVVGNTIGDVYTYVYDKQRNLLHSDAVELAGSFKKVYDLSQVASNGAIFEVYNSGKQLVAVSY